MTLDYLKVTTQDELDKALAGGVREIDIISPSLLAMRAGSELSLRSSHPMMADVSRRYVNEPTVRLESAPWRSRAAQLQPRSTRIRR